MNHRFKITPFLRPFTLSKLSQLAISKLINSWISKLINSWISLLIPFFGVGMAVSPLPTFASVNSALPASDVFLTSLRSDALKAGWEDLEMKAQTATGALAHLDELQVKAWTLGYYERLPMAFEFAHPNSSIWHRVEGLKHYSLECDTFLSLGRIDLKGEPLPFGQIGDQLIFSLKSELYSRCDGPIIYPWTLKLVLRSASGEIQGEAQFRGQPHRIRQKR
jgi:hypothetical protein